jgi:hypothetical protein
MSQTISLYRNSLPKLVRNTHSKLVSCVVAVIVSGTFAFPIGMMLTKRLLIARSPVLTIQAVPQPAAIVPVPIEPADRIKGEAAANGAASVNAAPDDVVTSAGPPADSPRTVAAPIEPTSTPVPNAESRGQVGRVPAAAAAEGGRTGLTVAPSHASHIGIHKTPHEAVLALLAAMSRGKAGTQPMRHVAKAGARNGPGSSTVKVAQLAAGTNVPMAAVNQSDRWGTTPGVLGGPAISSQNRAGLNGTDMHRRP